MIGTNNNTNNNNNERTTTMPSKKSTKTSTKGAPSKADAEFAAKLAVPATPTVERDTARYSKDDLNAMLEKAPANASHYEYRNGKKIALVAALNALHDIEGLANGTVTFGTMKGDEFVPLVEKPEKAAKPVKERKPRQSVIPANLVEYVNAKADGTMSVAQIADGYRATFETDLPEHRVRRFVRRIVRRARKADPNTSLAVLRTRGGPGTSSGIPSLGRACRRHAVTMHKALESVAQLTAKNMNGFKAAVASLLNDIEATRAAHVAKKAA